MANSFLQTKSFGAVHHADVRSNCVFNPTVAGLARSGHHGARGTEGNVQPVDVRATSMVAGLAAPQATRLP